MQATPRVRRTSQVAKAQDTSKDVANCFGFDDDDDDDDEEDDEEDDDKWIASDRQLVFNWQSVNCISEREPFSVGKMRTKTETASTFLPTSISFWSVLKRWFFHLFFSFLLVIGLMQQYTI